MKFTTKNSDMSYLGSGAYIDLNSKTKKIAVTNHSSEWW